MKCPQCGTLIDTNSEFCFACGLQIKPMVCGNCGTEVKEKQKYCKKCGIKL